MKRFSWKLYRGMTKNLPKYEWLKENHMNPYTEDQYVVIMKSFRDSSIARKRCDKYSPYTLRHRYRYLKEHFGFFISNDKKHGMD